MPSFCCSIDDSLEQYSGIVHDFFSSLAFFYYNPNPMSKPSWREPTGERVTLVYWIYWIDVRSKMVLPSSGWPVFVLTSPMIECRCNANASTTVIQEGIQFQRKVIQPTKEHCDFFQVRWGTTTPDARMRPVQNICIRLHSSSFRDGASDAERNYTPFSSKLAAT
jgi:hypothetical protein